MARFSLKWLFIVLQWLIIGFVAFIVRSDLLSGIYVDPIGSRAGLLSLFILDVLLTGMVYRAVYVFMRNLVRDTIVSLRNSKP